MESITPRFRFALFHTSIGEYEITAPEGWDDMQNVYARDDNYHGISAKYTLDFGFHTQGRKYLQTVYDEFGIEGVVLLIIYELEPNEGTYFISHTGRINLSKFKENATFVTTNAEETGFVRALLNLDSVEVDLTKLTSINGVALPRFVNESTPIELHSKAVIKRYEGRVSNSQPAWNFRPVDNSNARSGNLYIGFDDIKFDEFNSYNYATGLLLDDDELEIIEFKETGSITVELNVDVNVKMYRHNGDFDEAELFFFCGLNNNRQRIYYWNSRIAYNGNNINGALNQTIRVAFRRTFAVVPGDKLYVYGRAQVGDISGNYEFEWEVKANPASYLKVSGATTAAPSTANGFLIHELFARLVAGLTGQGKGFYSELLGRTDSAPLAYAQDGAMSALMVLNGSAIRGFPMAERPLYASLREAYQSLNALVPIGIGTETTPDGNERVRLEGVGYFYQSTVVLELGPVKEFERSVAQEYYANEVEVGYEKWESGEDNSLDEVNTKQTRTTAVTQLKGKYTAISKYSASAYLIESVRRLQFAETPTKEDGNDKTNFWVCVLRSPVGGFITERNQQLSVARNVLSPETMYNARITPMRNFRRHGPLIRVGLWKMERRPVAFQQGNANYLFESQFIDEAAPVVENEYTTGEQMPAPLWLPEYYDFTAPLPFHHRKKIEQNPYGIITFIDPYGETRKGYIKKVTAKLNDGEADFRLLRYNG